MDARNASDEVSILILVGLPGSGKSTIASSIVQHYLEQQKDHLSATSTYLSFDDISYIEYDAVASDIYNDENWKHLNASFETPNDPTSEGGADLDSKISSRNLIAWRKSRHEALKLLRNKLDEKSEQKGLQSQYGPQKHKRTLVVMDDNFHLRSMRRDVYKVCQDFIRASSLDQISHDMCQDRIEAPRIGLAFLYVDTKLESCLLNNDKRSGTSRFVPEGIIRNMNQTIEAPDESKAKFELCTVVVSDLNDNKASCSNELYTELDRIISLSTTKFPVSPPQPLNVMSPEQLDEERLVTLKSRIHKIDLILRALVGATCRHDKKLARGANEARKTLLMECKNIKEASDFEEGNAWILKKFIACVVQNLDNDLDAERAIKIRLVLNDIFFISENPK
mmetsp:Transcript_13537/g.20136  ORF Transcript_13537/g.20136 Transcript_13537/m.20136 type:complete len:394 (-) Transcript_13537:114-1295(-)|eukprot:CAMPEP_0194119470 /NCGR_PEP_ID=MMETSP0150-20130528/39538_1 /TAXON_ID=122233 /ORGANISM="Chaetoceros debilis, Strain MM31A-1" /LENGTH=393 /DNA_ID=CAMNT_0038811183 /DNA_START=45 /DNA_END=1226 /DNA_ORIENTATION=-